jgi:hypothetical protein
MPLFANRNCVGISTPGPSSSVRRLVRRGAEPIGVASVSRHWSYAYADNVGKPVFTPDAEGEYTSARAKMVTPDPRYPGVGTSIAALTVTVQPSASASGGCTALPLGAPAQVWPWPPSVSSSAAAGSSRRRIPGGFQATRSNRRT